jgi:LDH2 family malate/lactate/ureidoglycolate dehydrogenase
MASSLAGHRKLRTDDTISVAGDRLEDFVQALFQAVGLPEGASRRVAGALVDADRDGRSSHGVMLVPLYLDRIGHGSVSKITRARVVHDAGTVVVLDAQHALGQLTADQAMATAVERALRHGMGAVAVRRAFHFGTASRYALAAAEQGCVGIAMCNTRPLMPAPGGAEPLVGNNPIAIALPSTNDPPVVMDMALSAAAMGKIRMAAAEGCEIPASWATDAQGVPTTDAAAAITGMLLPAAGPKGFGLAFMIDLLCGALSSGAWGARVTPLYGDLAVPYDCAHFFLALNVASFRPADDFAAEVAAAAARVQDSTRAPGVTRVYSPGEIEWQRRERTRRAGDQITLPRSVAASLRELAAAQAVDSNLFS